MFESASTGPSLVSNVSDSPRMSMTARRPPFVASSRLGAVSIRIGSSTNWNPCVRQDAVAPSIRLTRAIRPRETPSRLREGASAADTWINNRRALIRAPERVGGPKPSVCLFGHGPWRHDLPLASGFAQTPEQSHRPSHGDPCAMPPRNGSPQAMRPEGGNRSVMSLPKFRAIRMPWPHRLGRGAWPATAKALADPADSAATLPTTAERLPRSAPAANASAQWRSAAATGVDVDRGLLKQRASVSLETILGRLSPIYYAILFFDHIDLIKRCDGCQTIYWL